MRSSTWGNSDFMTSTASMRTRRGSRSTVSPLRANAESGTPPRFSAECIGGTCSISPLKLCNTRKRAAWETWTAFLSITSPSASPVVVFSPNLRVARYSLSSSSRWPANFVASPNRTISSPDASGSSVPAWPALVALKAVFASCRARFELMPTGLSRSSPPSIIAWRYRSLLGGVDQAREPVAALDRLVVLEAQLRSRVELDAPRELRAKESGGALEPHRSLFHVGTVQRGEKDLGMGKVRRHVDPREGDHAHARVAQLALHELRELALDQVTEFVCPPGRSLPLHPFLKGPEPLPPPRTPRTGRLP